MRPLFILPPTVRAELEAFAGLFLQLSAQEQRDECQHLKVAVESYRLAIEETTLQAQATGTTGTPDYRLLGDEVQRTRPALRVGKRATNKRE